MSKGAPFYRIYWEGMDVSDKVSRFRYRDSVENNNRLALTLELEHPYELDDDMYRIDTLITFKMGLLDTKVSPLHYTKVKTINPEFSSRVKLSVEAYDLGADLKEGGFGMQGSTQGLTQLKMFRGESIRASDIARNVAFYNGLSWVVDDTEEKVYEPRAFFSMNDHELLQYLASREDNFLYFSRNKTLYFVRRDLGKKPKVSYSYGNDDRILKFRPKMAKLTSSKEQDGTETSDVDPETGETRNKESGEEDGSLGRRQWTANARSLSDFENMSQEEINDLSSEEMNRWNTLRQKKYSVPSKSDAEAENTANAQKKEALIEEGLTATVETEGDPYLEAGAVVTMNGVGKRYSGNWYIHHAEHVIEQGRTYETRQKWGRNAAGKDMKKGTGEEAPNRNKQKGPDETDEKQEVAEWLQGDENAEGSVEKPMNEAAEKADENLPTQTE